MTKQEQDVKGLTDEHEDHGDEDARLEHVGPRARVADDADGVACGEACEATAEAGSEVDHAGEERVGLVWVECADDEDGDDEAVHGDDARHDDRNQ